MIQRCVPEPAELESVIRGPAASPLDGDCRVVRGWLFKKRYDCGHRDARRFHFVIWGAELRLHKWFRRSSDLCPECLLRQLRPQIIRCADCRGPILPGEPIATPCRDDRDQAAEWLTTMPYGGGELVVTCLCSDNALGFSGHWNGERIRRIRWEIAPDE